jgi:hypothetical protein
VFSASVIRSFRRKSGSWGLMICSVILEGASIRILHPASATGSKKKTKLVLPSSYWSFLVFSAGAVSRNVGGPTPPCTALWPIRSWRSVARSVCDRHVGTAGPCEGIRRGQAGDLTEPSWEDQSRCRVLCTLTRPISSDAARN